MNQSSSTNEEPPFQELYFKAYRIMNDQDTALELKNLQIEKLQEELHETRMTLLTTQSQLLEMSTQMCSEINESAADLNTTKSQPRSFISFKTPELLNRKVIYFSK